MLIEHIEQSIAKAWQHESRLPPETLEVRGKTSPKIRHLLNNLCSLPDTVFLEAGSWEGASLVSALCGNEDAIREAYAVDCWNQYGNPLDTYSPPEKAFDLNTARFLVSYGARWHKIRLDLFDVTALPLPPTIFYYDADHAKTEEGTRHFFDLIADPCIVCLDDWGRDYVHLGWRKAIEGSDRAVVQEWDLPWERKKDTDLWWEGFYVCILERPRP